MTSGPDVAANLDAAARLIAQAAQADAQLVVLPENFALMGRADADVLRIREQPGAGPLQEFLAGQARSHGVWLVGGTIPLVADGVADKVHAACLVFDAAGRQAARYDKIHLFDVQLAEGKERYAESETFAPGERVTVLDTPVGKLGLAVCYDLRFPELLRAMLDAGVEIIALPAAFTAFTGQAHWDVLVRARAIENLCYVVAAAQSGRHASGRETHGHSMIVDPWGAVLGQLPHGSGLVSAEVDHTRLGATRRAFPALEHRRLRPASSN